MILTESDFNLSPTDAGEREPFAVLTVPAGQAYRFSQGRPQALRTQILKRLTGQDLTGQGSVTVNLDTAFPKPKNANWQDNDFSAVAFIHDDNTSPTSADKESISAFNYAPTNSVVVAVSAGNQTTGQTVSVYYAGGDGILAVVKQERARGSLAREVYLFGPVPVAAHLARDPFLEGSILNFKPFVIREFEQIKLVYKSSGAGDTINVDQISGVTMPLYIRLEVDELFA